MSTGDSPVVLCVGAEGWLRGQAIAELKSRCVAAGFEEADFVRFDPDAEPQAILEAARTAPLGSPRRLVIVDGLEELSARSAPWLADYLAQPSPKSCVVLCADRVSPEFLRSAQVRVVACPALKGKPLEDWVLQRCRQKGKAMDPAAAAELIRRMGAGLQGLHLALESLCLLAGDSPRVTRANVESLIAPSIQQTAFEILDSAGAGRTGQAIGALREATALGRLSMDQFLGAVGWYLRRNRPALLGTLLRADVRIKLGHPAPEWLADLLLLKLR